MRRAFLLLFLAAGAGAQAAGDRAFLETVTSGDTFFVGAPIRVTLRIGFDRAYFESNVVQMFQRELDVPVQVDAKWLDELDGVVIGGEAGPEHGVSFALNGEEAVGVLEGDPFFGLIDVGRVFVPTRAGELVLTAPKMRFVYGTQIREDFFGGRVALDPQDALVVGRPVTLRIEPLPEEGRPDGFSGPVGRIAVSADATPRELDAGASLEVVLRIEGEDNLEFFDAPRLDGLAGFHSYGLIDDEDPSHRTVRYHLVPLAASVREIPAITVPYFDPEARAYRTAATEPIPITVRPQPGAQPPPEERPAGGFSWLPVGAGAALVAVALFLWLRARRRRARTPDPAAVFRTGAARPDADLAELFADFLAAHLGCTTASVITPDLRSRLTAAGVPEEIAARTASLVEKLVAVRYGGNAPDDDTRADALGLVDAIAAGRATPLQS